MVILPHVCFKVNTFNYNGSSETPLLMTETNVT